MHTVIPAPVSPNYEVIFSSECITVTNMSKCCAAIVFMFLTSACGDSDSNKTNSDASVVTDANLIIDGNVSDANTADAAVCTNNSPPTHVFLNRSGGTYTPGIVSDSRINTTPIAVVVNAVVGPLTISDADWDSLKTCVEADLADFNIQITDQDPGDSMGHMEVVVTDDDSAVIFGLPDNLRVIATSENSCNVIENGIAFVFGPENPTVQQKCNGVSWTVAKLFSLDTTLNCLNATGGFAAECDVSGDSAFLDQLDECLNDECLCSPGMTEQNSYLAMGNAAGFNCDAGPDN